MMREPSPPPAPDPAAELADIARAVTRLSPEWQQPERFHEAKSEISARLRRLADVSNGAPWPVSVSPRRQVSSARWSRSAPWSCCCRAASPSRRRGTATRARLLCPSRAGCLADRMPMYRYQTPPPAVAGDGPTAG